MTASSSTASDALNLPSPVAISLCWCWMPKPGYSSRTRRSPTGSLPKTKPVSWWSTNGICSNRSSRRPARTAPTLHPAPRRHPIPTSSLRPVGPGISLFPRLRTRHFHVRHRGSQPQSTARVGPLCRRPTATTHPHRHAQPHHPTSRRTPTTDQPAGHFLKFFYATQTQASPPPSSSSSTVMNCSQTPIGSTWPANSEKHSATKVAPSCSYPRPDPRPSSPSAPRPGPSPNPVVPRAAADQGTTFDR